MLTQLLLSLFSLFLSPLSLNIALLLYFEGKHPCLCVCPLFQAWKASLCSLRKLLYPLLFSLKWKGNIIPMNTDRCSVYKYFVSLRNKRQKWVSLLLKIGKKSDLPRSNQNKFNQVLDIELYLLIRNTPTQT